MFDFEFHSATSRKGVLSDITSVITEPEPAIIHFKNTRKSGFACITLLSGAIRPSRHGMNYNSPRNATLDQPRENYQCNSLFPASRNLDSDHMRFLFQDFESRFPQLNNSNPRRPALPAGRFARNPVSALPIQIASIRSGIRVQFEMSWSRRIRSLMARRIVGLRDQALK